MDKVSLLKTVQFKGETAYPVMFHGEEDPSPMVIFYDDPEEMLKHHPDTPPYDGMDVTECPSEIYEAALHNLNVLNERDLISLEPPDLNFHWNIKHNGTIENLEVVDTMTGRRICTVEDGENALTEAKRIVSGRSALHCLHCLYTILQREAVYDPVKHRQVTDTITGTLTTAGYGNVMRID